MTYTPKETIAFYERVFDWTFQQKDLNHFEIYNGANQHIADTLEISNDSKGNYEYWVCTFGGNNLQESRSKILENGGSIIMDEGERILFTDDSGQAFYYIREIKSYEECP